MKTFNLSCVDPQEIVPFIHKNNLLSFPTVLVQVYSGVLQEGKFHTILSEIKSVLPFSTVIGATTDGEICNGEVSTNKVAISFMVFEKTTINAKLYSVETDQPLEVVGQTLVREMLSSQTKLLLLLANSLSIDVEGLMEGINENMPETKIAGALAGVEGNLGATFVGLDKEITSQGIVAVAFESDELQVHSYTNHSLKEIGINFSITSAEENVIKQIDNKNPLKMLIKYLGKHFVQELPESGAQFPLIINRNGKKTTIYVINTLEEGFIQVDRKVHEGEQFTFSYANAEGILESSKKQIKDMLTKPVESILIFNCMARRRNFEGFVLKEIEVLQQIAPTFGYFSYGEIQSSTEGEVDYRNFTSIHLALSESNLVKVPKDVDVDIQIPDESKAVIALSNLIDASSRDIVKLNRKAKRSEQRYKSLFEHNSDIVFSVDLFGRIISVNPRFTEIFGFSEKQILRKSALNFLKTKDIERVTHHFFKALDGIEQTYEIELIERDGEERTYLIKHVPIVIDGARTGVFGIGRDITAQKKAEERVAYLAYYDPATSLPNRQNFNESLKMKLDELKKSKEKLAVMFIDFDRFKLINDSLGHLVGDELLKRVITQISHALPANCYLARFGGDKFSLSYTGFNEVDEVFSLAKSLLTSINQPIMYQEQEFYVTASIGVSLYPNDGVHEESLLKNADAAMNQAKKLGGNRMKFYSDDMNSQALHRIELESYLRKALEKNEFFLCYQPFIDIESQTVIGAEALIRWNHPKLGLIPPADFIPLAEETGIIAEIGVWVLNSACRHTKQWQDKGYGDLNISVNVSAQQFQQPKFVEEVKNALATTGLSPRHLHLELTESVMLRNASYSIEVMESLRKLGVQISVDDFGTGYSSLSYLRDLPINNLKIDRSFIKNLRVESKDHAIVHAIITMGKGLNLNVIAEGIETEEQLRLLKELTCDVAQGFYLSKPRPMAEFERFMIERQPSFFL
ncbi:hypothetical protein AB685_13545 [Bacillus sp. LL01]|uniref:bifunctional diguanylate cyclase/phosphodiesterase n=1 Tax=Bacillus sp. LL01 TaxID=1665556 RepID=UPI00064D35A1|nr:EAL domain-containing protein [Bacillus sp. LL01]KMJ57860.1 hypothetical protein AB685_13545 [Bacillus sp. LL01]